MSALRLDYIKNTFDPSVYKKGRLYRDQAKVFSLVHYYDDEKKIGKIRSRVKGAKIYKVNALYNDTVLGGSCTCPLQSGCKHIVATYLEALIIPPKLVVDISSKITDTEEMYAKQLTPVVKELKKMEPQEGSLNAKEIEQLSSMLRRLESWSQQSDNVEFTKLLSRFAETPVSDDAHFVKADKQRLAFLLFKGDAQEYALYPIRINVLKNGGYGVVSPNGQNLSTRANQFDRPFYYIVGKILHLFDVFFSHEQSNYGYYIKDAMGVYLLNLLVKNSIVFFENSKNILSFGAPLDLLLEWERDPYGIYSLKPTTSATFMLGTPIIYVDEKSKQVGVVEGKFASPDVLRKVETFKVPPFQIKEFNKKNKKENLPLLPTYTKEEDLVVEPLPVLALIEVHVKMQHKRPRYRYGQLLYEFNGMMLVLEHRVRYECVDVDPTDKTRDYGFVKNGTFYRAIRNFKKESEFLKNLKPMKLKSFECPGPKELSPLNWFLLSNIRRVSKNYQDQLELWMVFLIAHMPALVNKGWIIDTQKVFEGNLTPSDADSAYFDVKESSGTDWFSTELGVSINGEKVNLLPVLLGLLRSQDNLLEVVKKKIENKSSEPFLAHDQGRIVSIPLDRAYEFLKFLNEFYDRPLKEGKLELTKSELLYLELMQKAEDSARLRWIGVKDMFEIFKTLQNSDGRNIPELEAPKSLKADLRGYQTTGYSWLSFLQKNNLAGILADDMGLGKTIQAISYMLSLKEKGLLTSSILIVAPTSLMVNWSKELEKFAPTLSYVVLHGANRKQSFHLVPEVDVVLTTYPLLARDREILTAHIFHTIILDEAQTIKNAKAQTTLVVHQLKAAHRFCLTGTPMENHLGELWSLFHFLMPGYLGNQARFTKSYRFPIEKRDDTERRNELIKRVTPFILRRKKDEVALDLPPKTEIIQRSFMEKEQRDLYETYRLSLHDKVQEEIKKFGLHASQIVILDALLKLRQICCDPRLLKTEAGSAVKESAKLIQLMDMLPSMVEEGRRILLFSQFTSMLALIEGECDKLDIPYVILKGDTRNRAEPIDMFQDGKVPLFLISLKAGGTGLNLTAADTVIHYDPWWNPAVEDQATDRAHRIGQDKSVFVYKMITEGTVEEKIIELQQKKGNIAKSILENKSGESWKTGFNGKDLEMLFDV